MRAGIVGMCLLLAVLCGSRTEAAAVVFSSEVVVQGRDILLGDVADLEGAGRQDLAGVKLANAAVPGEQVVFTDRVLLLRLKAAVPDFAAQEWHLPPQLTVRTACQMIAADKLTELVTAAVYAQLQGLAGCEVKVPQRGHDVRLPVGELSYKVEFPHGVKLGVPVNTAVGIYVDGELCRRVMYKAVVQQYCEVAVAAVPIKIGKVIEPADIRMEQRDLGRLAAGYCLTTEGLLGRVAKRVIAPGQVMSERMVKEPDIVFKDTMVDIVAYNGNVRAAVPGRALQDGHKGQLIRVKNISSNKIVTGKVIDAVTIEIIAKKG